MISFDCLVTAGRINSGPNGPLTLMGPWPLPALKNGKEKKLVTRRPLQVTQTAAVTLFFPRHHFCVDTS